MANESLPPASWCHSGPDLLSGNVVGLGMFKYTDPHGDHLTQPDYIKLRKWLGFGFGSR